MEDKLNVCTEYYDKANREKALKVLEVAKKQEAKKLKKGAKYMVTANKTWALKKE